MDRAGELAAEFEGVRLRLLAAGVLAEAGASLALTAGRRGEGVSTVAIGLATALARQDEGAVLLVDSAVLGQRAGAMLGLSVRPVGLAAVAAESITPVPGHGFDLLTVDGGPRDGGRGGAEGWKDAWQALRGRYRHVIVDAGSLRSDTPLLWSPWVDKVALVIDSAKTTEDMILNLRRELAPGKLALSGFILNRRKFHVPGRLYQALR
ncbi:MAG: hypothetical protein JSR69_09750 [Proteobacteria bacterium]|nr:hypothetical protein [Pseudomonadota bacterium]